MTQASYSISSLPRKFATQTLACVLATCCITAALHVQAARAANDGGLMSVLVMGDSYSAGNGAGSYFGPKGCYRSAYNYGRQFERLFEKGGQRGFVETVACNGDTTRSFFASQSGRPPQLRAVDRGYDLVLLTAGGNDLHFSDIAQKCLVRFRRDGVDCEKLLANAERELERGNVDGSVERRLGSILTVLGEDTDPRAKIVLLGYPYLEGNPNYHIRRARRSKTFVEVGQRLSALQDLGDRVQQRVVDRVNRRQKTERFVFVKTKKLFAGQDKAATGPAVRHELFAQRTNPHRWFVAPLKDPSVSDARKISYHPNRRGWYEIASLLMRDKRVPKKDLNSDRVPSLGPQPPRPPQPPQPPRPPQPPGPVSSGNLLPAGCHLYAYALSPDGQTLVFPCYGGSIARVPLANPTAVTRSPLARTYCVDADVSADLKTLALVCTEGSDPFSTPSLLLVDLETGQHTPLQFELGDSDSRCRGYEVELSDDARYVAFSSCVPLTPGAADDGDTHELYVLDRTTGVLSRQNHGAAANCGGRFMRRLSLSSDGGRVTFEQCGRTYSMLVGAASSQELTTEQFATSLGADMSDSGRYVTFVQSRGFFQPTTEPDATRKVRDFLENETTTVTATPGYSSACGSGSAAMADNGTVTYLEFAGNGCGETTLNVWRPGSSPRVVTRPRRQEFGSIHDLLISRDGRVAIHIEGGNELRATLLD